MPEYDKKEHFEVYNVISAKDALALIQSLTTNREINTQDAEDFFISHGVTVFGLIAPAYRLADRINEKTVETSAKEIMKNDRARGRS
jgi:hypothetical protein